MSTSLVLTLVTQMVRSKLIGPHEIDAMAVQLEHEGNEESALMLRGAYLEALQEPAHEFQAKQARARFRIVKDERPSK